MFDENTNDVYQVKLEKFEGPLDVLIFLIKNSEINIFDIPISEITAKYIEYLSYLTEKDINNLSEFISMASLLVYIKSYMLLPVESDFEEDSNHPTLDLVNKLIEYQQYKNMAELLETRYDNNLMLFQKKPYKMNVPSDETADPVTSHVSIYELLKLYKDIIQKLSVKSEIEIKDEITVEEMITELYKILAGKSVLKFSNIAQEKKYKLEIICLILAILELAKRNKILLFQDKPFSDIVMKSIKSEN